MFSKVARVRIRKFHRWAGIIIGLQLVFWVASGTYFSWMPIKVIRDEDRAVDPEHAPLPWDRLVSPQALPLPAGFQAKSIRIDNTPYGTIYRLESTEGKVAVYDAITGSAVPYLEAGKAAQMAEKQINTDVPSTRSTLLNEAPEEYGGPLPVYQVSFDDFRKTRLYLDPWSGRILTRRNMFWRVYDFLWMLHILDFKAREDFNNIWLRTLSFSALIFIASGYALFLYGRPPKRAS